MRRNRLDSLTLVAALALVVGCSSDPKPSPKTEDTPGAASGSPAAAAATSSSAAKADVATPTSGSVRIDDAILKACGDLPMARFAFDSASLGGDAERGLIPLAKCFVSGPLAGRTMRLVGHADNRGEAEYNFALGHKRASSVSAYLAKQGMTGGHLQSDSRGATEATGTDDEGWARDRRVDISLAP